MHVAVGVAEAGGHVGAGRAAEGPVAGSGQTEPDLVAEPTPTGIS